MRYLIIAFLTLFIGTGSAGAQGFVFGVKGGMAMGLQQWNGFNRQPLFRYHADLFIESWNEENKVAVFAMGGYHVRGSTIKTRPWYDPVTNESFNGTKSAMQFNNLVLTLGAKQKFPFGIDNRAYYGIGIRGEYTVGTNFAGYLDYLEGSENKFVFGVSLAGGIEIPFSRYVGGIIEVSVNPDFTKQIYIPPQDTGFNDTVSGTPIRLNEQNITNLTFEFTIGFRFLREVIYVD